MPEFRGWNRSQSGYTVRSPDELMHAVSRIGTLNASRRYVWRGAADYRWHLESSLVREIRRLDLVGMYSEVDVRATELAAIKAAREWGIGRELGASATDLHVLAVLQHHGVATRLLDVTTNPMTALYFACQETHPNVAGVLFAFDVTDSEVHPTLDNVDAPSYGALERPRQWTLRRALATSAVKGQPFLVVPALPDTRMLAQEGLFLTSATPRSQQLEGVRGVMLGTTRPVGRDTLQDLFSAATRPAGRPPSIPFCAIVIHSSAKSRMRQHLEQTFNRTDRTMFPDIDGFQVAWNRAAATRRIDHEGVLDPYNDEDAAGR